MPSGEPLCVRDPDQPWATVDYHAAEVWQVTLGRSVFVAAAIDARTERCDGTFPGLRYTYGDRLEDPRHVEFLVGVDDIAARREAGDSAAAKCPARSARGMSAFLSVLWAHPVEVCHVRLGVQRVNGYPWAVFGWRVVSGG